MALAVAKVGGNVTTQNDSITSDSWTSVANSLIVVIGHTYNTTGAAAGSDVTDSKSNTYTLAKDNLGGADVGLAVYYNNDGTRGASHTVTFNGPGTPSVNIAVIEITGQDLTAAVFDTTTDNAASDGTTPYDVTAAAAISGNQIAIYGVTLNASGPDTWTQPSGYTNIINQPNGSVDLVSLAAYKTNETGTPTVGAGSGHVPSAGREVFVTFKEAAGAGGKTGSGIAGA